MKTLRAAIVTAFLTGTFTLAGFAGFYNSGESLWIGTVIGGAIRLLIGLGVVYPSSRQN